MKHTNRRFSRFQAALVILLSLYFTPLCGAAVPELSFQAAQSRRCVDIVNALERDHFTGKVLNTEMSAQVFDTYIKYLDPGKHLLTQTDLDQLAPLKQLMYMYVKRGDLGPAFEIFNLYQARSDKRLEYILSLIDDWQNLIDFTKNDTIVIDYEHKPFLKNEAELQPLWKKELKNHIISLKLDNTADEELTDTLKKIYSNRRSRLSQTQSRDVFQIFMNAVTMSFDPHFPIFRPPSVRRF